MTPPKPHHATAEALAWEGLARLFRRNGYVRQMDPERRRKQGQKYRKGDEVRLVAETRAELALIRRLLRQAGYKRARAFVKGHQYVQPLYGRAVVAQFLDMVAEQPEELS